MSAPQERRELERRCEARIVQLVELWSRYTNSVAGDGDTLASLRQALHDATAELASLERARRETSHEGRGSMVRAIGPHLVDTARTVGEHG